VDSETRIGQRLASSPRSTCTSSTADSSLVKGASAQRSRIFRSYLALPQNSLIATFAITIFMGHFEAILTIEKSVGIGFKSTPIAARSSELDWP
jgi:hypothetical protein